MLTIWMLLAACSTPADPSDPPPEQAEAAQEPSADATAEAEQAALDKADATAMRVGKTLKKRMVTAMGEVGPSGALEACSMEAQDLTEAAVAAEAEGARAGRASLKLRNPANRGPDWVQSWLESQPDDAAEAEPMREIADTPEGRVARVIKPIGVAPECVACHGDPETIPADVKARLSRRYPEDHATGYEPGDLRGALWAEVPVTH